jgi:hypothetical protein
MKKLLDIIEMLIKRRFTGTLTIEFFEGGIRAAHQDEKVI